MSENVPLSERIKWKAFRLYPAGRDLVVVSKATLDRWINEIAALEQQLAEATKFIQDMADGGGFTGASAKDFLENTHD